jgi:hypothetical protein
VSDVTFTRQNPGTYDAATDVWTSPTATTITGHAIQVRGDPQRYRALGLVLTTMPTLFFSPTTYGETPAPGDTVTWTSIVYTVRDVAPIAPDGVTIAARVIVSVP